MMWAKVIDEVAEELGLSVSFYTARATPPVIEFPIKAKATTVFSADEKRKFDETRLAKIKDWSPPLVIFIDRWSFRTDLQASYSGLLDHIKDCGSQVLFFGQPPEVEVGDYSVPLFVAYQTRSLSNLDSQTFIHPHRAAEVSQGNERVESISATSDFIHFLSVHDLYIGGENEVLVRDGDQILYIDEDHLSYAGALRGKALIKSKIAEFVK